MLISQESADLITNEISTIMRKTTLFTDENGIIIAATDCMRIGAPHTGSQRVVQGELDYFIYDNTGSAVEKEICFPVTINQRIVGTVVILCEPDEVSDIVAHYSQTISRIAEVRIRRLTRRLSREEERLFFERAQQIFFESTLFSGTLADFLNKEEIEFRASLLGIDLIQPRVIASLTFTNTAHPKPGAGISVVSQRPTHELIEAATKYIKTHISDHPQNLCFTTDQHIVILFCSSSIEDVRAITGRLCQSLESFYAIKIYGGISSVSENALHLQRCYNEAKTACRMAQKAQKNTLMVYNLVSLDFIVQSLSPEIRTALADKVFRNASEEEISEISTIILTYCNNDGNAERAAAALFMHRNTFLYRMNKIKATTGYNPKSPNDLLILCLAALSQEQR